MKWHLPEVCRRPGCQAGAHAGRQNRTGLWSTAPPTGSSGYLPRRREERAPSAEAHARTRCAPLLRTRTERWWGREDISWARGDQPPIGKREAGRVTAAVPLPLSAPHRRGARARRGLGGGAGLLRMKRAGTGSAPGDRAERETRCGCGCPKAAGFLAGLGRLGFRARHAERGHARAPQRVEGPARGKSPRERQRRLGRSAERAAGEGRGTTHPSMAHRADPRGTERRRRNSRNRPNGSEL